MSKRREQLDKVMLKRSAAFIAKTDAAASKKAIKSAYERTNEAQVIIQAVAETVQQQAHKQIASVVSRCLATVFDDPYEFKIHFERKRGKTEARLVFVRNDNEIDPLSASGGGVVDVAAFALRLSCLMLSKPRMRKLIVLDEPMKFVSKEHLPRLRTLLVTLASEMKVQLIMITHIEELQCGTVITID